jgi:hypothetical protein
VRPLGGRIKTARALEAIHHVVARVMHAVHACSRAAGASRMSIGRSTTTHRLQCSRLWCAPSCRAARRAVIADDERVVVEAPIEAPVGTEHETELLTKPRSCHRRAVIAKTHTNASTCALGLVHHPEEARADEVREDHVRDEQRRDRERGVLADLAERPKVAGPASRRMLLAL